MNFIKGQMSSFSEDIKDFIRPWVPHWAWARMRAHAKPLKLYQPDRFTFFPVVQDPPVIYTTGGGTLGNAFCMARALDGVPASFIVAFHRQIDDWKAHFLERQAQAFRRRHGGCELTILAPDTEEKKRIESMTDLDVRFINKNAFTREDDFQIQEDRDKEYDAIMNARTLRVKRIELARRVDRLAMITVVDNKDYFEEMRSVLDGATWLNFREGEYTYLSRTKVASALNAARTGLILSAVEGTNRASIEYMLCGLPVVSTPSKGGRDVFFDEEYCAIVDPTADAVRRGVKQMITRDIPPTYIRKQTLRRVREHRSRFLALASELAGRDLGIGVDEWLGRFPRDLEFRCEPEEFLPFLQSDYFEGGAPEYTSAATLRCERPKRWSEITGRTA